LSFYRLYSRAVDTCAVTKAYVLLQYKLHLSAAIKIVRQSVVQERALLEIREINRLRREVKVLGRALVAANRLPRA
jgi:hypothetical protein